VYRACCSNGSNADARNKQQLISASSDLRIPMVVELEVGYIKQLP
jgi:hypothetical protein